MEEKIIKIIGIIIMFIVILNLVLFAFRVIDGTFFWTIIVLGAVFTYVILPRLKKK